MKENSSVAIKKEEKYIKFLYMKTNVGNFCIFAMKLKKKLHLHTHTVSLRLKLVWAANKCEQMRTVRGDCVFRSRDLVNQCLNNSIKTLLAAISVSKTQQKLTQTCSSAAESTRKR